MKSLVELLAKLRPERDDDHYLFVHLSEAGRADGLDSAAFAVVREREGTTLVVEERRAKAAGEQGEGPFARITLTVHSSLHAVGLTAAVAQALAAEGIPANIVAGCLHDHLFVPAERADEALGILGQLERDARA